MFGAASWKANRNALAWVRRDDQGRESFGSTAGRINVESLISPDEQMWSLWYFCGVSKRGNTSCALSSVRMRPPSEKSCRSPIARSVLTTSPSTAEAVAGPPAPVPFSSRMPASRAITRAIFSAPRTRANGCCSGTSSGATSAKTAVPRRAAAATSRIRSPACLARAMSS